MLSRAASAWSEERGCAIALGTVKSHLRARCVDDINRVGARLRVGGRCIGIVGELHWDRVELCAGVRLDRLT